MLGRYKKIVLIVLLIIVGWIFFAHPARAQDEVGAVADWAMTQILLEIANTIHDFLAKTLVLIADIFKYVLSMSFSAITDTQADPNYPGAKDAISLAWGIMRDFVNLIFILLLVVIAFGTIFDTGFGAKNTLGRLIIAALLVNFSLIIGKIVIEFANVISVSIINSFGGIDMFTQRLGQVLQPQHVFPGGESLSDYFVSAFHRITAPAAVLRSALWSIIITITTIAALSLSVLIAFLRIPFLWAIMIFSPVAWASLVLPQTRKFWNSWWQHLIHWSFILPLYLFFVYMGVLILFSVNYSAALNAIMTAEIGKDEFINEIFRNFGYLFSYLLGLFFMFGGAWAAHKIAGDAGKYTHTMQRAIGKWTRGKLSDYTGAGAAWQQLKETGRIGTVQTPYRGTLGREWTRAQGSEWIDPAKAARKEKELVDKEMANLQSRGLAMKSDQEFQQFLAGIKGSDARGLAAKMLLAERGKWADQNGQIQNATPGNLVEFYEQAKSERTPLSIEYTRRLEEAGAIDKWDLEKRKRIAAGADPATNVYTTLRKMAALSAIKEDASAIYDVAAPVLKVMPTAKERHAFIEKFNIEKAAGKVTSANRAKTISQLKTLDLDPELKAEKEKLLGELKKFNPALVAEATGENIKDAIRDSLSGSPQNRSQYMSNLVESYGTELAAVLKTSLKSEVNSIFKTAALKDREALGRLGIKIKKQRKKP